jgi:hypothetical protein
VGYKELYRFYTSLFSFLHEMTLANTSVAFYICDLQNDDRFGPLVQGCRRSDDFTILFEQGILSIAPAVLFLLAFAIRMIQLRKRRAKVRQHQSRYVKLVCSPVLLSSSIRTPLLLVRD